MLRRLLQAVQIDRQTRRNVRSKSPAAADRVGNSVPANIETLEKRELLAASPVFAGTKIKGINLSANNISTNQTLITIPFTGNITLTDVTKLRLFGYADNPLSPHLGQVKKTVNIISASVLSTDHSFLQITTDRLMRKGGTIIINSGALTDDNNLLIATQTLKTVKGQNKERFTLACREFVSTNHNFFTPAIYSDAATPTTANTAIPEATVTAELQAFLDKKVAAGTITQAAEDNAMTRYNSASVKGIVPDANLRAAIFSLTGTFAENAIGVYLDGDNLTGKPYTIVAFQNPDDPTVPVTQTSIRASDGRLRTVFKPTFQGEPFEALSAWVAHEATHQDSTVGLQEEEAATVVETLVYGQQAMTDPTFLSAGTALVNLENEKLAAFVQSGRTIFPYPGLIQAPALRADQGVFPGQVAPSDGDGVYTSWQNFISRGYIARGSVSQATDFNPTWDIYYQNITGKTAPAGEKFNDALITDIDSFQQVLGTHDTIVLAGELGLGLA